MSGYDTNMDLNDVDLTITAPPIFDEKNKTWDALVERGEVLLSWREYGFASRMWAFNVTEAERLGKRLIAAAEAARASRP